jgi:rSAM/selenodomain-associated transferase 1
MRQVIVFLKAPRPGLVKTRLSATMGAEAACTAYRQLVGTVLDHVSGLPAVTLCYSPDDAAREIEPWLRGGWSLQSQGEGDLGQRMSRAFSRAFQNGARRVVIIGSDCPTMAVQDIEDAWTALETNHLVLGPATDGGYWLMGLHQAEPILFEGISWSTESVFQETLSRAKAGGLHVKLLRTLSDIDTEADWKTYLRAKGAQ